MRVLIASEISIDNSPSGLTLFEPTFHFLSDECLDFFLQLSNISLFGCYLCFRWSQVIAHSIQGFLDTFKLRGDEDLALADFSERQAGSCNIIFYLFIILFKSLNSILEFISPIYLVRNLVKEVLIRLRRCRAARSVYWVEHVKFFDKVFYHFGLLVQRLVHLCLLLLCLGLTLLALLNQFLFVSIFF